VCLRARSTGVQTPRNRRYRLVRRASPRSKIRAMARWLALIAITQQVSCSGGSGAGAPSNGGPDAPTPVTVSISPSSAQIAAGASVDFIATVQNATNLGVNWQVNGLAGGNSSVGTIAPSGAGTATYTAPANVSAPLMVTVGAVSQADATKSGSATVTIQPSPAAHVSVSPADPDIVAGGSQQFTATVQNGAQAVIWEVNGIQLGNSSFGFINSSGFYKAPTTIPSPPMVIVTAILQTDLSISGSTTATIVAPSASVSISPSTGNVVTGKTLQFFATAQNSTAALIWEVNGISGGDSTIGTIASAMPGEATYTAPASVPNPPSVTITAALQTDPSISGSAGVTVISGSTFTGVYSWRNDNSLTGQNAQEIKLTPANVGGGQFGKLFGCAVDGAIFAQPLYVANVTIPSQGTHNVVYVATEHDSVYAFDANSNPCQTLWQVSFINAAAGVTIVPSADITGQTDIVPEIGITGTPVIDPATATLYVVAKTKENGAYVQRLHALDLAAGTEKLGGPATIQAIVNGSGDGSVSGKITFDSPSIDLKANQRSALLFSGGKIYVAFDSYEDTDPFHGWLFAYNAADLASPPAVFNSTPNGSHGGIGESGAAPSSDVTPSSNVAGNVFAVTSDGTLDANLGGNDYADTLLNLPSGAASTFAPTDSFTRSNETVLNLTHQYFGSTGVLLLPDSAGSTIHPHLALAGDEASNLYLLDRDNLATDGALETLALSGQIFGTPAYWAANNTVYVAAAGDNLKALPVTSGSLSAPACSPPTLCSTDIFPLFGASPVISSNGSSSGIVWALDTSGYATSAPAILHAYDATNLANKLYSSPASATDPMAAGLAVKFAVPTVANGKVYVGTQGELSVFGFQ
jgi:hypothetical protein